jgi:hypothetical protein
MPVTLGYFEEHNPGIVFSNIILQEKSFLFPAKNPESVITDFFIQEDNV